MSPRPAPTASSATPGRGAAARRAPSAGPPAPTSRRSASAVSTGLCRWRKGPWRVALVSDDRRLAEACGSADIVLSTVDAQGRCRGPRLVIDRRDAWREGAQALWLDERGVRRETANARRGDRPWVPNSSARQAAPGQRCRAREGLVEEGNDLGRHLLVHERAIDALGSSQRGRPASFVRIGPTSQRHSGT